MHGDWKQINNRGGGYDLERPICIEGNLLAVKWLSDRTAKERTIVEEATGEL